MKTKLVIVSVIVVLVLAVIGAFILLRGDEDNWICEKGEWIKHGNPEASMPETPCPGMVEKNIDQPENIPPSESNGINQELIGGERDEYGCLGSAGYTWCEEKQKCLRTWEEECSTAKMEEPYLPDPALQPLPLPTPDSTPTPSEEMPVPLPLP